MCVVAGCVSSRLTSLASSACLQGFGYGISILAFFWYQQIKTAQGQVSAATAGPAGPGKDSPDAPPLTIASSGMRGGIPIQKQQQTLKVINETSRSPKEEV